MKITLPLAVFINAVRAVAIAADPNSRFPAFGYIHAEAAGETLRLAAASHKLSVSMQVPAFVETDGGFAMPATLLEAMATAIADSADAITLTLHPTGRSVAIALKDGTAERSNKMNIKGLPLNEMPIVPHGSPADSMLLPSNALRSLIGDVAHAASPAGSAENSWRSAVFLALEQERALAVATDGIRFCYRVSALPQTENAPEGRIAKHAILPAATALDVRRLLPIGVDVLVSLPTSDDAVIRRNQRPTFFVPSTDTTVTVQEMEVNYVSWERILAIRCDELRTDLIAVHRDTLMRACEKMRLFKWHMALSLLPDADAPHGFSLNTNTTGERGDIIVDLDARLLRGAAPSEPVIVASEALDVALKRLQGEYIGMHLSGPTSPVTLCPLLADGESPDLTNIQTMAPIDLTPKKEAA